MLSDTADRPSDTAEALLFFKFGVELQHIPEASTALSGSEQMRRVTFRTTGSITRVQTCTTTYTEVKINWKMAPSWP
jgi:hypothetical protein